MVLTGWTPDVIRRQPADVIRRLVWRVFARAAWDADLARFARVPLPPGSDMRARDAKASALKRVRTIETALWPEDEP